MRYPEIDIVKGIAVIFMVIFHFFYLILLYFLNKYPTHTSDDFVFAIFRYPLSF